MPIKFGTDGWRGIIGEDYTFQNVRYCAQGTADYLKQNGLTAQGLVIGYDTRFASEDFAAAVAEVTAANGIKTTLTDRATPTPVLSYNLVYKRAGGGVMITASHNPGRWNGFKYKPGYGGSASSQVVYDLERHIARAKASGIVERMPLADAQKAGLVEYIDPDPPYLTQVASLVDLEAIRHANLNVVVDSMFGAGTGFLHTLLEGGTTRVFELHGERNPVFPGMSKPEPIAHNLVELTSEVGERSADAGLATDGDADRLGVVDEKGQFLTTLQTFALLCLHQLEVLGKRGPLVRSVTMTSMVDSLGEIYGVPVHVTPVGFGFLGPVMLREDALAAGEESGGYAFRGGIPVRDGILSGLILLEMMAKTGKPVSELLRILADMVGPHHYDRWDLPFDEPQRSNIKSRLSTARPGAIGNKQVVTVDTQDGFHFVLEGGYWTLVRFSGTEPLLRVYAEAESPEMVTRLLRDVRIIAGV